jgi:hypothetical protein
MDTKRKACDIRSRKEKHFISRHILHQHWYTQPIALPVCRNPQHRCLLTAVSATSAPPFQTLRHQAKFFDTSLDPAVNRFTRHTLPTVNRKHVFMNILCIESFCPQKESTTDRCSSVVHTLSTVVILTAGTSLWTCACHEAGLCCYLVIHIEKLLRPLQLFYCHLRPTYWISLVVRRVDWLCLVEFISLYTAEFL